MLYGVFSYKKVSGGVFKVQEKLVKEFETQDEALQYLNGVAEEVFAKNGGIGKIFDNFTFLTSGTVNVNDKRFKVSRMVKSKTIRINRTESTNEAELVVELVQLNDVPQPQ